MSALPPTADIDSPSGSALTSTRPGPPLRRLKGRALLRHGDLFAHDKELRRQRRRYDGRLLAFDLGNADRTNQMVKFALRNAHLPGKTGKPRPFGLGADQADEVERSPPQRRDGNVEIECVRVRHDDDQRI